MRSEKCPECGASGYGGYGVCPKKPTQQVNLMGMGWRTVPHCISDCIHWQKGQDKLEKVIIDAYERHRRQEASELTAFEWELLDKQGVEI